MLPERYRRGTLPCAFFFLFCGSIYSMTLSRMPAIKARTGMDDGNVGLGLFCFGMGSMAGLAACNVLVRHVASRSLLRLASLCLMVAVPLVGLVPGPASYCAVMAVVGFCLGLTDVCTNTQGILHERKREGYFLGFFQACYSFGGIVGAAAGFLFAALGIAPFWNFAAYSLLCLAGWAVASPSLHDDIHLERGTRSRRRIPAFLVFCGFLLLCVLVSEGSIGDWGSIFLHSVKGAPESIAALSFGACALAMFVTRLFCDRLRERHSDFFLIFAGSFCVAGGLVIALVSPWPLLCLAGYLLAGFGGAPVFPIIMSRVGAHPGMEPAAACALASTLGFTGLLFVPPLLGWISRWHGLTTALIVPVIFALLLGAGSFAFRDRRRP